MHNGSALLRVDATATSVRIKVSAAFPLLSRASFLSLRAPQKDAKLSVGMVFLIPLNNFESDRKDILFFAIPGTIKLKYAAERDARASENIILLGDII